MSSPIFICWFVFTATNPSSCIFILILYVSIANGMYVFHFKKRMICAFPYLHLNKIIVFELELELEPHMLIKFYNEPSLLQGAMIPTALNMNPEIDQLHM